MHPCLPGCPSPGARGVETQAFMLAKQALCRLNYLPSRAVQLGSIFSLYATAIARELSLFTSVFHAWLSSLCFAETGRQPARPDPLLHCNEHVLWGSCPSIKRELYFT